MGRLKRKITCVNNALCVCVCMNKQDNAVGLIWFTQLYGSSHSAQVMTLECLFGILCKFHILF